MQDSNSCCRECKRTKQPEETDDSHSDKAGRDPSSEELAMRAYRRAESPRACEANKVHESVKQKENREQAIHERIRVLVGFWSDRDWYAHPSNQARRNTAEEERSSTRQAVRARREDVSPDTLAELLE